MVKRYRIIPVDMLGRERTSLVTYAEECDSCGCLVPVDAVLKHKDAHAQLDDVESLREQVTELGEQIAALGFPKGVKR